MEGTDDRGTKEERALARCVSLLRLSSDSSPIPPELAIESVHLSLSDSSKDGSEVSTGYDEMDNEQFQRARQELHDQSRYLTERLMEKMREKGFVLGELQETTRPSFAIPRCFTVQCPDGSSIDPFTQKAMEILVAISNNEKYPYLVTVYNFSETNHFMDDHTAFLNKGRNDSYRMKTWCKDTIFNFNKAVKYQQARCIERTFHGILMSYLSHRGFIVENVPTPTDRDDVKHLAYHDHCMVVISFADIDFKPQVEALNRCRVSNKRGVVIQLFTGVRWGDSDSDYPRVFANIYSYKRKWKTIYVKNCTEPLEFCSSCQQYLVTECARVQPPL